MCSAKKLLVRRGLIFTYECIFPAECDYFWQRSKCQNKTFCCLSIANKNRTPPKKQNEIIKSWCSHRQQIWEIFIQVCIIHFEYWFLAKFFQLTFLHDKSRPTRKTFRIQARENNNHIPGYVRKKWETIFIWTIIFKGFFIGPWYCLKLVLLAGSHL